MRGLFLATGIVALSLVIALPGLGRGAIVFDSVNEFSGVQGQDGWQYGYYDGDHPTAPFSTQDFEQLPTFGNPQNPANPPYWYDTWGSGGVWTLLGAQWGHPNGTVTSGGRQTVVHWAVRRWVSDISGPVNITGELADADTGPGNGIIGHILVDGTEVFSQTIDDGDSLGVSYSVDVNLSVGSIVDFAIDPRNENDLADSTVFTSTGRVVPEPSALGVWSLLILCGAGIGWRRRRKAG